MATGKKTILIGEDDLEVRGYLEMAARSMGYEVVLAHDGEEVLACLRQSNDIGAVLLDIIMPRKDGIETLRDIRKFHCSLPVIVVSDASSTINVVQAMKIGATDFLPKPIAHEELRTVIHKAFELTAPAPFIEDQIEPTGGSGKLFFGTSRRMSEIRQILREVAPSDAPVLIQGETGAGKEVVARELHALSLRAQKSFLKLNCAALPSELVESELFGYERGAFTGAFQKKAGMFELADGGTILLDEIGDMDFKLQAKFLQVLQDHEFQRIGGKEVIRVDVRVMAATHQNLERAIKDRFFREDLYYRLNVIGIQLPALRERKEDIIPMAEFLIRKHIPSAPPALTAAMKQVLLEYNWPGNIRELENLVRRLIILRDEEVIIRELRTKISYKDLPSSGRADTATSDNSSETPSILAQVTRARQEAETTAILAALNSTRWNRKQAALILKIDYKALLYKMRKLGIDDDNVHLPVTTSESKESSASITSGH